MSSCIFIAADIPLKEVKNPHYKLLSVNEAISRGIAVSEQLLSPGIDRNDPTTVLWSDSELIIDNDRLYDGDAPDNFALLNMEDSRYYCDQPYGVYIEWNYYTKERAAKIVDYIKTVLRKTNSVEIWNVWISDWDLPQRKVKTIRVNELDPALLKQITETDPWQNKSFIGTDSGETPISRCIKVLTK